MKYPFIPELFVPPGHCFSCRTSILRKSVPVEEVYVLPLPSLIAAGSVVLRPHKSSDLERFTEFIVHPDSTRYMLIPEDRKSADGAAGMLQMLIDSYNSASPVYSLTIADARSDSFLGFCQLWPTPEAGVFEIVYAVLPAEQGEA